MSEFKQPDNLANFREAEEFSLGNEIIPPAVDLLLKNQTEGLPLPSEIAEHPKLQEQSWQRRELNSLFSDIFENVPDTTEDLGQALKEGKISKEQLTQLYQKLTVFFKTDENNLRAILYLPFEILPNKAEKEKSANLAETEEKFIQSYLKNWRLLLLENDVRANLIDGDFVESEISGTRPPWVKKAAHLIPNLVQKNLLTGSEVLQLYEDNTDPLLQENILDALAVLSDLNLVDGKLLPPEMKGHLEKFDNATIEEAEPLEIDNMSEFIALVNEKLSEFDKEIENQPSAVHKRRAEWLKEDAREKTIDQFADQLAKLVEKNIAVEEIANLASQNSDCAIIAISGIRKNIEKIGKENPTEARETFSKYENVLVKLQSENSAEVSDALHLAWYHLAALKVIGSDYLSNLGLPLPQLEASLDAKSLAKEKATLNEAIELIKKDPTLSEALYPSIILFGSRLKGYASPSADLDVAVLVKSGYEWSKREELKSAMEEVFSDKKGIGKVVEFWMNETTEGIKVRDDIPVTESTIAEEDWAHVLFGGAWFGEKEETKQLFQKTISQYLLKKQPPLYGIYDSRMVWLREMEREALQYRLMHKGYGRFYPRVNGINTKHSKLIDSQSDFWDPGFRRIATKLFLSKVFLPDIAK